MSTSASRGVLPAADVDQLPAAIFDMDFGGARLPDQVVAQARSAARALGYAAGWADGQRRARESASSALARIETESAQAAAAATAQLARALGAVIGAAGQLERRPIPDAAEVDELIVATALALAEAVLGRELVLATDPGGDALRRALAANPTNRPVLVRLHPDDYHTLVAQSEGAADRAANQASDSVPVPALAPATDRPDRRGTDPLAANRPIDRRADRYEIDGRIVTLLPDPTLLPGDALAECDATSVDARLAAAMDRIRAVLLP